MARTYRKPVRYADENIFPVTDKPGKYGDRHLRQEPKPSIRVRGVSTVKDYSDECGGNSVGQALRIASRNAVKEGIRDFEEERERRREEVAEQFREAYGDDGNPWDDWPDDLFLDEHRVDTYDYDYDYDCEHEYEYEEFSF